MADTSPAGLRPATGAGRGPAGAGYADTDGLDGVPAPSDGVPTFDGVPAFDGVLSTHDRDLAAASTDFGRHVHRRPSAVLRPAGASDVAAMVRFCRGSGLPVVARGTGHSVDGRALTQGGVVIDMTALAAVREPARDRVVVEAGARWSAVLEVTLAAGTAPPVLPDYLGLSVGGVLAAGGISGASHRHGCLADHVHDLDVVTPSGALVTCSRTEHPALFDAVRGSQGRHGIIARATLALTPAPTAARRYRLPYQELETFLADQQRLAADRRFDHIEGHAAHAQDTGWGFTLSAVAAFDPPAEPDDRALIGDLAHDRAGEQIDTVPYRDFLHRAAPAEARLRANGSWHHPHPRSTLLLPGRHAAALLSGALRDLDPGDLGAGGQPLIYPIPTASILAPNVPRLRDPMTVVLSIPRTAPPDDPAALDRMRHANDALRTAVERAGGSCYPHDPAHFPAGDSYDA
ncbi:FAD-binding protein [Nonomuraea helvata]|uniref:FAD-binding protein n=1 Tax=Nonomuraea helvata TaxID=37484 RepID=A0ABV5S3W4_9ACTN